MTQDRKITEWILEYCYDLAKREFKEKKQIEENISRDFIQGILDQLEVCGESSVRNTCMVQVLVIMCKLADGQDITVEYEEGTELSALEGVLERLDCLSEYVESSNDLAEFRNLVKQQAVFVFARSSDFAMAHTVAKRVFDGRPSPQEKTFKRRTDDVLQAKDPAHPFLSQFSYDKLLEVWFSVMELLEAGLKIKKPFLVECAKKFTSIEDQKSEMRKRSWEELDVNVRGDTLQQLLQHFNAKSVPMSPKRRAQWHKRCTLVRKNKDDLLGSIEMVLEKGNGDGAEIEATSEAAMSESMSDGSPVNEERRKRKDSRNKSTNNSLTQRRSPSPHQSKRARKNSAEDESSDDLFEANSPRSCLPARPSVTKSRRSLAPASPRHTLNVSKLSHLSMGGRGKRPWEPYEEEALWEGVQTYGIGKWSKIKDMQNLPVRTSVDIKDKWRNIVKDKHKYTQLAQRLGHIPNRKLKIKHKW